MLRLCGFHISNYHNKVRIALLEKGIEHVDDASCKPSQDEAFLARSPMGKVPFLELDDGRRLAESDVILEYLEEAYPQKPLLPKDPWQRAKVREPASFSIELRRRAWSLCMPAGWRAQVSAPLPAAQPAFQPLRGCFGCSLRHSQGAVGRPSAQSPSRRPRASCSSA